MITDTSTIEPFSWLFNQLNPLVNAKGWTLNLGEVAGEFHRNKPQIVMVWESSDFTLNLRAHHDLDRQVATESLSVVFTLWAGPPKGRDLLYFMRSFLLTHLRKTLGLSVNPGALIPMPEARANNGFQAEWTIVIDVPLPQYFNLQSRVMADQDLQFTDVYNDGRLGGT